MHISRYAISYDDGINNFIYDRLLYMKENSIQCLICDELHAWLDLVVESFGAWGQIATDKYSKLASRSSMQTSTPNPLPL